MSNHLINSIKSAAKNASFYLNRLSYQSLFTFIFPLMIILLFFNNFPRKALDLEEVFFTEW